MSAGVEVTIGGACALYVDMPLGEAVAIGDWIATTGGSRYLVTEVRKVTRRNRHAQQDRYQLRVDRLPKGCDIPTDEHVIWMRWYQR